MVVFRGYSTGGIQPAQKMLSPESCYFRALKHALEGDLNSALAFQEKAEASREAFGLSFSESVSDSFPFVEEAVTTLLSSYDFTRCVRSNGTAYGTSGKCRKGSEKAKSSAPPKKWVNERELASEGKMSKGMAALFKPGMEVDFYKKGSGDKSQGIVQRNDGKVVSIKEHNGGKVAAGRTQKFEIV